MKNKKFLALIMALVMVISLSSVTVFATSDVASENEETTSVEATTSETSDTTVSDTTDSEEAANNESDENGAEQTTEPSDDTAPADTEESTDPVEENKEDTPANEEDTQTTGETTPVEEKTEETTEEAAEEDADPVFTDVAKDAWYAEAVNYAYEKGYMIGVGDSKFAPDAKMTRATMAMVLYNVEGKPEVEGTTKFTDVASDTWYAKAVLWAEKAGVTNGTSDTTFSPDDIITREQFVTMLYRYAKSPDSDIEVKADSFKDMDGISEWAKDAVIWAIGNKLLVGCDDNIMPQGETTRAQAATVLQRYDSEILNPVSESEDESDTTPADEAPENTTPADETPAEDTPSEDTPADENPDNTPSEETPSEGSDNPSEDTPEDGTPSDETPAEDTPSDGESNENN